MYKQIKFFMLHSIIMLEFHFTHLSSRQFFVMLLTFLFRIIIEQTFKAEHTITEHYITTVTHVDTVSSENY